MSKFECRTQVAQAAIRRRTEKCPTLNRGARTMCYLWRRLSGIGGLHMPKTMRSSLIVRTTIDEETEMTRMTNPPHPGKILADTVLQKKMVGSV
jgi:hypothetical protein